MPQTLSNVDKQILDSIAPLPEPVARPALVMLVGLPGTGKSFFTRALVERYPLAVVETDAVRKLLFGNPTYQPDEHYRVHKTCYRIIAELLRRGIGVAFDATNLQERAREQVYHIAEQWGARLLVVKLEAPPEVVKERLERRAANRDDRDRSDATWDVYQAMASSVERIRRNHYTVDTSQDIGPVVEKVVRELRRR